MSSLGAVLLTVLASAQIAPPPVTASIAGQVVNGRTLEPIQDALVGLSEAGRQMRSTADGRFAFEGVSPGTYTLTVSTVGYIFVRRPITVAAGSAIDLQVPLAEGTGTYEETVRVTAAEGISTIPTTTVTLTSAALQDLRAMAADDPVRAMQALPGASTGDDFRAEFSVRGSAFRHVGVVVDGTPTTVMFHRMGGVEDPGSVAMINTDVLAGATLDVGNHPRRHGNWLGATMAFDLREGSRDRRTARFAVSGTNASVVAEGPIGRARRGSWLVSLRRSYVDWLVRVLEPEIESTVGFSDGQLKVGYDVGARHHIEAVLIGGRAHYEKSTATGANQINHARSAALLGSVAWRYARGRLITTQRLSIVRNDFKATGSAGQEPAAGDTHALFWRGDATVFVSRRWLVEGGGAIERAGAQETRRDFASSGGSLRVRQSSAFDRERILPAIWGQAVRTTAQTRWAVGVRTSADSTTNVLVSAPWLTGERQIGRVRLFGGVGRSTQIASLVEVGRSAEPLGVEQSWGVDAGVAHALTDRAHWRVSGFGRHETNGLRTINEDRVADAGRVVGSTFEFLASRLTTRVRGVEAVLERRSETGGSGWVAYTWTRSRAEDRVTGERFNGDFDQRHTFNLFVQQRVSYRVKLFAKLRMGSNFPIVGYFDGSPEALFLGTERNTVRLPVYSRFDIGGRRTFTYRRARLTMFIEFVNLWNRHNLGPGQGSIRANLQALGYAERLLPLVPSGGLLLEY